MTKISKLLMWLCIFYVAMSWAIQPQHYSFWEFMVIIGGLGVLDFIKSLIFSNYMNEWKNHDN